MTERGAAAAPLLQRRGRPAGGSKGADRLPDGLDDGGRAVFDGGFFQAGGERFVPEQCRKRLGERGEISLPQDAAEAERLEMAGVFELVAAGGALEGDEEGGLFEGERLEHRVAARPRENEVCRRVGACHIGLIGDRFIPVERARRRVSAAAAAKVHDLKRFEQGGEVCLYGLVEGAAAASPAEDEKHGLSPRKAVFCTGAGGAARKQLLPHGRADVPAVLKAAGGLFKGREDEPAMSGRKAGRKAGGQVALVREGGDVQLVCRPKIRQARVSPLGKDEIGPELLQKGKRAPLRLHHAEGQRKIFGREAADKFGAGNAEEGIAGALCEPLLDAARAPRIGEAALSPQFLHDGKVGDDVSGASSAAKEKMFHR